MDHDTVLVLAKPTEPQLAKLAELPPETSIAVGTTPEAFERTAEDATVIFSWHSSPTKRRAPKSRGGFAESPTARNESKTSFLN